MGERDMGETDEDPLPIGMIGAYAFCPRRMWLAWVDGDADPGARIVSGKRRRRAGQATLPVPGAVEHMTIDAVVAQGRGLYGIIDRVAVRGAQAQVEFTDAVEVTEAVAGALIVRAMGYAVDAVHIAGRAHAIDPLVAQVDQIVTDVTAALDRGQRPTPLVQSPRCLRCALAPVCQPDAAPTVDGAPAGRIAPPRETGLPLHINLQGAVVGVRGEEIEVRERKTVKARARLAETAAISVYGNVMFTTQALRQLMRRHIPVAFHGQTGWLHGMALSMSGAGLARRRAQYARADHPADALRIAQRCVVGKIKHQRVLLRRNHPAAPPDELAALKQLAQRAAQAPDSDTLRGFEGDAARRYYGQFGALLRPPGGDDPAFAWTRRSRRPPADLPNALLSFCYALLVKEWTSAVYKVGLDPMLGYLHAPRAGRPALALDLMEEYRPILADSVVIRLVNTGMIRSSHAVRGHASTALTRKGRNTVLQAWETRLQTEIAHPTFGYACSWRRLIEVQARLFAQWIEGEIDDWPDLRLR